MARKDPKRLRYEEGGIEAMMLVGQNKTKKPIETFRVKLERLRKPPMIKIKGPEDAVKAIQEMEDYDREHVKILHLDRQNRVVGIEETSVGGLDFAVVHPRETIKGALLNNSASVMFIHNHPSGGCDYSREDKDIYEKLKKAFGAVDVDLIDGLVVGKECYYSFTAGSKGKLPESSRKNGGRQAALRVDERKKRRSRKRRY